MSLCESPMVTIRVYSKGADSVLIDIVDNGPGVPKSKKNLFLIHFYH